MQKPIKNTRQSNFITIPYYYLVNVVGFISFFCMCVFVIILEVCFIEQKSLLPDTEAHIVTKA